ncbi:bifunctional 4-hydroxy-2-oxoglutarate aldolase/2-dehydro-3-deoxy-phosphogluconate aldolase [Conexibacter stalactiti]|uniref:Bifunctional 4-hydroxy-2-oxoglutarate aldolase/2-dehydro-3-deoxy-phosphogluconate aldolase n=1 Tax=Conexibacter stalactiti TaxID=1940611 RepID=A0ABU4I0N0_9ACTN|nr:bifunctional 4-hydroxy-2-oxoglutarate aldolase/2-dehydro-3-deoxy-phosphogluconate aldolase [Conexibacter stalactiti]MDW5598507.1 bifunctional 4-hydroxy-2-oxoglutarate aldolase/2-dehydro-3-deoxy-phosphogluconate aldolase [Conexibacter stalactiti]MEC5039149.1 bifunctional 4-hydroxy-2-oxoglutarate aldolase/2-dehydro-3-deoxy-phosphogluconate aldolase [Conexibacter stalactiti]
MSVTMEQETIDALAARGIVAVMRAPRAEQVVTAARALADGGVTAIEVTYTVPGAAEAIAALASDPRLLVGAGTIETAAQAREAVAAGARYLVSPHRCDDAIAVAQEAGLPAIPGVYTPTEVAEAARRCRLLKLFPASVGGIELLKALRAPFPALAFMPSGGVTAANLGDWLAAGAVAVGAGGDLVPADAIERGDTAELTRRAREWSAALTSARAAGA